MGKRLLLAFLLLFTLTACTEKEDPKASLTMLDGRDSFSSEDEVKKDLTKQDSKEKKKMKTEDTSERKDQKKDNTKAKKDEKPSKKEKNASDEGSQKKSVTGKPSSKKPVMKEVKSKESESKKPASQKPAQVPKKPSNQELGKKEAKKKEEVKKDQVEYKTREEKEKIPYEVFEEEDDWIPRGKTKVISKGKDGYELLVYRDRYVNGKKVDSELISYEMDAPEDEYVLIGTGRAEGYDDDEAREVHRLINEYRAKQGLSPMVLDSTLLSLAKVRAKEITARFDHTRPNGGSYSDLVAEAGLCYGSVAENIAAGQRNASEVMDSWLNSDIHRSNILGNHDRIGIALYVNEYGNHYWVQLFVGSCD